MTLHSTHEFNLIETLDPLLGNAETELNNARVSGKDSPEWQALLDRPMTFLLPDDLTKGVEQKRWTNATGTLSGWIKGQKVKGGRGPECGLSHHLERKAKGFFPIVFGASAGKDRTANAMVTQECMTLDVESGDFYLDAVDRAAELGIACIAYTSFNDQTEKSHVERDKVLAWLDKAGREGDPTDDDVREWMAATGRYRPEFVASVRIANPYIHTPKGVMIEIAHDPLDKFRMIFLLDKAVEIGRIARKVRDGRDLYKRKLLGLAEMLGLVIDESCIDVSRAFYMPSHPPGRKGAIDILRGRALTFEELPEGESSKRNAFEKAGAGAETEGREIAGMPAKVWAAKYAKRLEVARLIDTEASGRVRENKGGILVVECPFDEWHSNADDPADSGCHVRDGGSDSGFVWECLHNSCSAHDRLDMLHKALSDGWFDESCVLPGEFVRLSDDELEAEEEEKPKAKGKTRKPKSVKRDYSGPEDYKTDETRFEPRKDWLPAGYKIKGVEVYRLGDDDEGDTALCQAFDVVGRASNLAGDAGAGRIIHFENENGVGVEMTLSMRDVTAASGGGVLEDLADKGMRLFARSKRDRDALLNLFNRMQPRRHIPTVPRPGWVRDPGGNLIGFMCPTGEYIEAEAGHPFRLATAATAGDRVSGGTLEGWQDAADAAFENIGTAPPNYYWIIGACAGFAGPLLTLINGESRGFHFSGGKNKGKTTALLLGATAWATPRDEKGMCFTMSGTANAMELMCVKGSECVLALDELGAMKNPKDLQSMLFGFANGSTKSRMAGRSASAGLSEDADFLTFILMSSEHYLMDAINASGERYRGGVSRRFPDLDVSGGLDVGDAIRDRFKKLTRNYGHAGPAFVRWLISEGWHLKGDKIAEKIEAAAKALAGGANAAQKSAALVFATVQIAGELACDAGLLIDADKVRAAVLTAWQTFKGSDAGKMTEGETAVLDGFKSWLVRNMGTRIVDAGDTATHFKGLVGWYTQDSFILLKDGLAMSEMGIDGSIGGLCAALNGVGAINKKGKNNWHADLPVEVGGNVSGGRVNNLRLSRRALGLE